MTDHTILIEQYKKAASEVILQGGYRGLRIHALPGLHDFTGKLAVKHIKPYGDVLDLAAGSGAMSQRLLDHGFRVIATDYVAENFRLHESITFLQADLNDDFPAAMESQFDGVMASEIIEHLENPRHFARQCFKALRPGGHVILSTPNVDNVASIVTFLRTGCFQWFEDADYNTEGHITPLTQWQIGKSFKEAGFRMTWQGSFGDPDGKLKGSPRLLFVSRIVGRLSVLAKDRANQIYSAVFYKPA